MLKVIDCDSNLLWIQVIHPQFQNRGHRKALVDIRRFYLISIVDNDGGEVLHGNRINVGVNIYNRRLNGLIYIF